jgi:hypothetical protein
MLRSVAQELLTLRDAGVAAIFTDFTERVYLKILLQ